MSRQFVCLSVTRVYCIKTAIGLHIIIDILSLSDRPIIPVFRYQGFFRISDNFTPNKINKMIDVFHRRCLKSILGISWRDHITNNEVMARSEQMALHDTVANRRRRFVGHILRLLTTRPASLALEWIPEGGRRRVGRPKRTWQDTLKEDVDILGVDWSDTRDTANDRARWRQLVAQCSAQNGRN